MGVLPTDSRDEALRKETLVLAASAISAPAQLQTQPKFRIPFSFTAGSSFRMSQSM